MTRVRVGPIIFGFAILLLSLHPRVVEGLSWLIPINEQTERPVFVTAFLVLVGLAFIAFGSFWPQAPKR